MEIALLHVLDDGPSSSANLWNCITDFVTLQRLFNCDELKQCSKKRGSTKASLMKPAVCLCGWLKSLETPEGNPPDLQRDSTVGRVGRLLVWTDCIPYSTTLANRAAQTKKPHKVSSTIMNE